MADPGPVLVLGGSGFIGRQVGRAFAATGREVVTVSRNPAPDPLFARQAAMDLCAGDSAGLAELLLTVRPSVVVNAVGVIWAASESVMLETNAATATRLVGAVAALPYRPRLLHIGTIYEYAPTEMGARTDTATPEQPTSAYGRTKLVGSRAVLDASADGRIDGIVLRPSVVVGPGVAANSLLGTVADQLLPMRGTGPAPVRLAALAGYRDVVDVRDVAAAVVAAATRTVPGRIVNIGGGEAVPVRRLIEMLIAASGLPAVIEETDPGRPAPGGNSTAPWLQVDLLAAERVLGWRPRVPLAESLRSLWEERVSAVAASPDAPRSA